jgi:hypothetical protein
MNNEVKIHARILTIALCVIAVVMAFHWASDKFRAPPVAPAVTPALQVQPQVIHTTTETVREVAVQAAPKGNIFQFTEREGKQFVVIDGKEYHLAVQDGKKGVKIGENGQIVMTTETVAKVDVTDMVRAQVNDKLAIQSAELKRKYVKNWTVGAEITNKDVSVDITHKGLGITAGKMWKDKDLRIGPRFEGKF